MKTHTVYRLAIVGAEDVLVFSDYDTLVGAARQCTGYNTVDVSSIPTIENEDQTITTVILYRDFSVVGAMEMEIKL